MTLTREKIDEARCWLDQQRAIVHPGPIETVMLALDMAAANVRNNETKVAAAYKHDITG